MRSNILISKRRILQGIFFEGEEALPLPTLVRRFSTGLSDQVVEIDHVESELQNWGPLTLQRTSFIPHHFRTLPMELAPGFDQLVDIDNMYSELQSPGSHTLENHFQTTPLRLWSLLLN